ncbi:putative TrmH family tRNA/rRNA methyltransferase [Variibacter gotjawalensis]|uniref:Putative TrmH family tRNA/rRNA methyltransferase n=1 Tax=Variibacter gotjawalensis TaxID=1333996 RepID=A0A0S3PZC9_9BRAD|nr:23S rRNA (guanosine(2251)-2'-O)-methyltransferase RlmB [Variibacter gotjawalensis]NIK46925.1 23S rRNA (guanosine2251-2'-O)-methyltransferase [Variibacter gotjawalensis]RZS48829.1 23S rRNA (guanosine2251-2'-O)-methyltransferase [Variibacter gotjawalensis]BAT61088.1 putative TrmH family tRNA/rRNA methyltransferase [Variibacter gotjawalensis]
MRDRERPPGKDRFAPKSGPRKGRGFEPRGKRGGDRPPRGSGDTVVLYGWHSVTEALKNPKRKIRRLLATENAARRLTEEGFDKPEPDVVRPFEIDRMLSPDAVHNGLLAEAAPLPEPELDELPEDSLVLILDQITDPHNVGAVLRSAAAFGVAAIVTTARHSPEATGVLAKAASGALEHVPIVLVQNLSRGMDELRDAGFLLVGLDSEGPADLEATTLRLPLALVLGAEGKGLRQLTRQTCDVLARIDLPGEIKSLNVSNACAVSLYAARRALAAK